MAFRMGKDLPVVFLSLLLLLCGVCSVSASSAPSRVLNRFVANALSMLMKWMGLTFKAIFRTAILRRPSVKFEGGYDVETVFDGSKHGIEPYNVGVSPDGEILILDSANSNLHKISSSFSTYSRPILVAGSAGGYSGYVDGRLRQAMMNHPKGLTVDDRGNIYIADTDNMAIRKISDNGVATIAGGKHSRGWGRTDGPSEDATFSNDFDVVYSRSSCSLLVVDRGNKAIREIHLHLDDCPYLYGYSLPIGLGIAMVTASVLFGYMLALFQSRIRSIFSSPSPKEPLFDHHIQNQGQLHHQRHKKHSKSRYVPETLVIPDPDGPPATDAWDPAPRTPKDPEKKQRLTKRIAFYKGWWDEDFSQVQQQQHHLHRHQIRSSAPHTYYCQVSCSKTDDEIVFGAVQEQDKNH
ncbi:uncharacterized protein LOC127260852 [Andrographis paniculata]|uniref:uncharacterized protein LOC127260852 n=1 Tax=Andrographis paniculata TaxID=175694 RepID=UPI0021E75A98|nr:uncharacterized protein LOC127260852 [Andrographis paniculata]